MYNGGIGTALVTIKIHIRKTVPSMVYGMYQISVKYNSSLTGLVGQFGHFESSHWSTIFRQHIEQWGEGASLTTFDH